LFIYIFIYLYIGTHPFINADGLGNITNQIKGKYEKIEAGRYSSGLIELMERMMSVVWREGWDGWNGGLINE
jgi:hypothetical protein